MWYFWVGYWLKLYSAGVIDDQAWRWKLRGFITWRYSPNTRLMTSFMPSIFTVPAKLLYRVCVENRLVLPADSSLVLIGWVLHQGTKTNIFFSSKKKKTSLKAAHSLTRWSTQVEPWNHEVIFDVTGAKTNSPEREHMKLQPLWRWRSRSGPGLLEVCLCSAPCFSFAALQFQ